MDEDALSLPLGNSTEQEVRLKSIAVHNKCNHNCIHIIKTYRYLASAYDLKVP